MASHGLVLHVTYARVELAKAVDGAVCYAFAFELTCDTGTVLALRQRYSAFRRMAKALGLERPEAVLPPFPSKQTLTRQTPEFLLIRGKALERYLSAVLTDRRLFDAFATRRLLEGATVIKKAPSRSPSAQPEPPPRRAPTPTTELDARQHEKPAEASGGGGGGGGGGGLVSSATAMMGHPATALGLSLAVGRTHDCVALCVGCCVVGLAAGQVYRLAGGLLSGGGEASEAEHGGGGGGGGGACNGGSSAAQREGAARPLDGRSAVDATLAHGSGGMAPSGGPAAHEASSEGAASGGLVQAARAGAGGMSCRRVSAAEAAAASLGDSSVESYAAAEALEALRLFGKSVACEAADGWTFHSVSRGVTIHTNNRPEGPTWGMGVGEIRAPVEEVLEKTEDDVTRAIVDQQFLSSTTVLEIPHEALRLPGHEIIELKIVQNLFKSPAWPVGPRESLAVKAIVRSLTDGNVRGVYRSVLPERVPPAFRHPPKGYTRLALEVGGYQLIRTSPTSTQMTYVNNVDPKGHVPAPIVRRTVPERALAVARTRDVCPSARRRLQIDETASDGDGSDF